MTKQAEVPKLMWTGGWDSTFRLLQRLLIEGKPIEPVYVIHPERQSAAAEIKAMKKIEQRLIARYPHVKANFLPRSTVVFDSEPNDGYQHAHDRIVEQQYLGTQYVWMASFCRRTGIHDIELAIHRDDKAHEILAPLVSATNDRGSYRVDQRFRGTDEYKLFRFFRLPIFDLTKTEMRDIAKAEGFEDLMRLTWFCHTPARGQQPCGICNPCIYTIQEGLGDRVPWWGRVKYHFRALTLLKFRHA